MGINILQAKQNKYIKSSSSILHNILLQQFDKSVKYHYNSIFLIEI